MWGLSRGGVPGIISLLPTLGSCLWPRPFPCALPCPQGPSWDVALGALEDSSTVWLGVRGVCLQPKAWTAQSPLGTTNVYCRASPPLWGRGAVLLLPVPPPSPVSLSFLSVQGHRLFSLELHSQEKNIYSPSSSLRPLPTASSKSGLSCLHRATAATGGSGFFSLEALGSSSECSVPDTCFHLVPSLIIKTLQNKEAHQNFSSSTVVLAQQGLRPLSVLSAGGLAAPTLLCYGHGSWATGRGQQTTGMGMANLLGQLRNRKLAGPSLTPLALSVQCSEMLFSWLLSGFCAWDNGLQMGEGCLACSYC